MAKTPDQLATQMLNQDQSKMNDFDLFKSIHRSPSDLGRSNYLEGEEEKMWNELNKHFDLPKYEPNKYGFTINDKDKIVNLMVNGVSDGKGFGGWKVKPQDLGPLKRRVNNDSEKPSLTREQAIKAMKEWFMPNYYDKGMYDYTKMSDDEVYNAYLDEVKNYGNEVDEQLGLHLEKEPTPKESNVEFELDEKKYPDVKKTSYGFIYNVNGKSITDLTAEKKKLGYSLSNKDSGFTVTDGREEVFFKDFDSAYKYAKDGKHPSKEVFKNPANQAEAMVDDDIEYDNIDEDYKRANGPVNTPQKYQAYLKWLANGESFNK